MQSLWMVASAVFYALYGLSLKYAGAEGVGAWEVLFYRSFVPSLSVDSPLNPSETLAII